MCFKRKAERHHAHREGERLPLRLETTAVATIACVKDENASTDTKTTARCNTQHTNQMRTPYDSYLCPTYLTMHLSGGPYHDRWLCTGVTEAEKEKTTNTIDFLRDRCVSYVSG